MPPTIRSIYAAGANNQPFHVASAFMEPMIVLSHVAAVTSSLRLGIGVWLMPLRHPVMTAKSFVTLDQLSQGRVELAIGVGWMKEEFDVLGADYTRRGAITDDGLTVISQLLAPGEAPISTRHFTLPTVGLYPKPVSGAVQSKIIGGGYSPQAWRRASRLDGWYGHLSRIDPDTSRAGRWSVGAVRNSSKRCGLTERGSARTPTASRYLGPCNPRPLGNSKSLPALASTAWWSTPGDSSRERTSASPRPSIPAEAYAESINLPPRPQSFSGSLLPGDTHVPLADQQLRPAGVGPLVFVEPQRPGAS